MTTVIHLKVDGTCEEVKVKTLKQKQKLVGGYIERVNELEFPHDTIIATYANEDGHKFNLEHNCCDWDNSSDGTALRGDIFLIREHKGKQVNMTMRFFMGIVSGINNRLVCDPKFLRD